MFRKWLDSNLYQRQKENIKLSNFEDKIPLRQSEMAKAMMKDPYIFELSNLKENAIEKDIEESMLERIKNLLLEFGKGFSFVGNQYKIEEFEVLDKLLLKASKLINK